MLILPELALSIFATIWAFCDLVKCSDGHKFSKTVIEGILILKNFFIIYTFNFKAPFLLFKKEMQRNTIYHQVYVFRLI